MNRRSPAGEKLESDTRAQYRCRTQEHTIHPMNKLSPETWIEWIFLYHFLFGVRGFTQVPRREIAKALLLNPQAKKLTRAVPRDVQEISMGMLDRGLADFSDSLAVDDLIGAISTLLVNAGTSLETDLFAAKSLIDQASALIGWRTELHAEPAPIEARAHALAPWQEKRLAHYVTIKMTSAIRNADLAAAVGLSTSHFFKAFKKSFGATPQAYVAQCRVQHAKKLMLSTDQPLAQIALACGFADQAHFSTYFRRVTGNTPAQWRRTHGECSAGFRNGRVEPSRIDQGQIAQRA